MNTYEPGQKVKITASDFYMSIGTEGEYIKYDPEEQAHLVNVGTTTYHRVYGIPEGDPLYFADEEVQAA